MQQQQKQQTAAPDLPVIYMDYTMDEFRRNIQLPKGMTHLYERIYERGMEMSDTESSARMLMVPRGKRPGDASHISVADLDALANGLDA
ncbi:hypothetical protein pdul_cds_581 [Pandoravirus dulcis]|uniref:Uncharacterized protein n=1 Tax=Pandoravirus dulcis TaxID=1349409 RepID=S4VQZ6_9VIRU|nr:hypothetical protein pdul_cds_581 [Pandoravirus dulcis]AGO82702.1 hypothetical protein pdul_cds_581 [Pandoravirus dulcis]